MHASITSTLLFAKANNIVVYNATGAPAEAVAECVVCMMLYALRKVDLLNRDDIAHWNRFKFEGLSLSEQTISTVGAGLFYNKNTEYRDSLFLLLFTPVIFYLFSPLLIHKYIRKIEVIRVLQLLDFVGRVRTYSHTKIMRSKAYSSS